MSPATSSRELAARESDGVTVRLLWHPRENAVTVSVVDGCAADCFDLAIAPERALDAFYHPFATPPDEAARKETPDVRHQA